MRRLLATSPENIAARSRVLHLVTEAGRVTIPANWRWKYPRLTLGEAAVAWLTLRRANLERQAREEDRLRW